MSGLQIMGQALALGLSTGAELGWHKLTHAVGLGHDDE